MDEASAESIITAAEDESAPAGQRAVSAPAAAQQHASLADTLQAQLRRPPSRRQFGARPLLSQLPSGPVRGVPPIIETELEAAAGPRMQSSLTEEETHASTLDDMSLSAVVHGERLTIIPTCPTAHNADALASIADPAQIAEARVLLVASDLPSRYVDLTL